MSKFKSRKFILTVLFYITSIVFVLSGHLEVDQWIELSKWILGIYAVGNSAEHLTKVYQNRGDRDQ